MKKLKLFKILTDSNQQMDFDVTPILINEDHLVSVKPIKMMINDHLLDGFWIRTSNGKKYRAIEIPPELNELLEQGEKKSLNEIMSDTDTQSHISLQ
jgi:hypothetical protein